MEEKNLFKNRFQEEKIKEILVKRKILQEDFLSFCKYFFKVMENTDMWVNWHHYWYAYIVSEVFKGNLTHTLINVAPGATKSVIFSILLPLWGYARNPRCRFMCTSFSDPLIKQNSMKIKDLLDSKEFQELFPNLKFKSDSNSKSTWALIDKNTDKTIGEYCASTLFGTLTGFRAGYPTKINEFTGAIIVDDPLKPADAFSDLARKNTNVALVNTLSSRVFKKGVTPIIVIMQRLHADDPSNFLLEGNFGDEWEHLTLPAIINQEYIDTLPDFVKDKAQAYYDFEVKSETQKYVIKSLKKILESHEDFNTKTREYKEISLQDLIQRLKVYTDNSFIQKTIKNSIQEFKKTFDGGVSYWSDKEPLEELRKVEESDTYTFLTQYMQKSVSVGGNMFKQHWWVQESEYPSNFDYVRITADTAQKTGEANDFSVFLTYGVKDNDIYVLNIKRGKWEAPELIKQAENYYQTVKSRYGNKTQCFYIEDKSSGTGLIQTLKKETTFPIKCIQRNKDKVTRAKAAMPYIESGRVHIPETAKWKMKFLLELGEFSELGTAKHDDITDCLVTAVEIEYIKSNKAVVKPLSIY